MYIGLYIDADNISYKKAESIFEYLNNNYNNINIKKIFGDWSKIDLQNWHVIIEKYGLEAVQCFRHSKKQSTDIYLITQLISDTFFFPQMSHIILLSSDSDFIHACQTIKKLNKQITIIGNNNSNLKLVANEFIDINNFKDIKIKKEKGIDYLKFFKIAMDSNYVLKISKFKKNLKKIIPNNHNLKWRKIEENILQYDDFIIIKKKGRINVIYIGELLINFPNESNYWENSDIISNNYPTIIELINLTDLCQKLYYK